MNFKTLKHRLPAATAALALLAILAGPYAQEAGAVKQPYPTTTRKKNQFVGRASLPAAAAVDKMFGGQGTPAPQNL